MFNLTWDDHDERYYYHGLDRGVLYVDGTAYPWNGLTKIDETSDATSQIDYHDGVPFQVDFVPGDYAASISAIYFPDVFDACLGMPQVVDGLFVDAQPLKPFHLSYRTLVGSGGDSDMFGYQIHLVYNAMANLPSRQHQTMSATATPEDFTFPLIAKPVKLTGCRPSAHYFLDTRFMSSDICAQLEKILYGDGLTPGRMPTPDELYMIMDVGDAIIFTDHGDGTWSAKGSNKNVYMTSSNNWIIKNVNGTDHGDGTFTLWDTP